MFLNKKLKFIVNLFLLCVFLLLLAFRIRFVSRKSKEQVQLDIEFLNREKVHQENTSLVELVRDYYLIPPSTEPYNLDILKGNSSDRQGQGHLQALAPLLQKIKNGSFIECGAIDGESSSSTLWLEKEQSWTGLLVEADPVSFIKLETKHRKAWISNTCISQYAYPTRWTFKRNSFSPVLKTFQDQELKPQTALDVKRKMDDLSRFEVQCIPLFTFFVALDQYIWDFFSLDTDGSELLILKTIPFERVLIKIITVKFNLIPEGTRALDAFMASKGYKHYTNVVFHKTYIHITVWNDLIGTGRS